MSIVRIGLGETKHFAEGYETIFGKKTPAAGEKKAKKSVKKKPTKAAKPARKKAKKK